MAATGKQAVRFYGLAAREGRKVLNRYKALDIAAITEDCSDSTDKALAVIGELLCDDKAADSIVKILAGYKGVREKDVTTQYVMSTVLEMVTDEDMGESVASFLAFCNKMNRSSESASANTAVPTISTASRPI